MKKTSIIFILIILISATSVFSQKAKYAFIDKDSILISMPEMKTAETELNTFVTELQNEVTKMNTEYEQKVKDYEANKEGMSELISENKIKEINELQKRIQEFQVSAQEEIIAKRDELLTPVFNKFSNAVETIAKKKGYSAVFPITAVFYYNKNDDITRLVMSELGIK